MPTFDQLIVRRRIESIKTGELLYTLQDPQTNQPKYRPRGAGNRKQDRAKSTTQRNSSQFEYVEVKMKKEEALKKRKAGNDDLHTKKKRIKIKKEPLDSGDDEKDVKANTSEDEDGSAMPEDKYGCLLPKRYYDISSDIDFASYDNIANIKIDGFCGFRAIGSVWNLRRPRQVHGSEIRHEGQIGRRKGGLQDLVSSVQRWRTGENCQLW